MINYCNEKLHQFITTATIKDEQEELIREGLEWTKIDYFNNMYDSAIPIALYYYKAFFSVICQLLEYDKHGILPLLDELLIHSDATYLTRIEQCCGGHSHCLVADSSLPSNSFQ